MSEQTKTCKLCQKVYPRKGYETDTHFALRQYCGVVCSRKAVKRMGSRYGSAWSELSDSELAAARRSEP